MQLSINYDYVCHLSLEFVLSVLALLYRLKVEIRVRIEKVEEKLCNICISFVLRLWISTHRCLPYNYYYVCTVTCCMEEVKMYVSDCSFRTFTTTFVQV